MVRATDDQVECAQQGSGVRIVGTECLTTRWTMTRAAQDYGSWDIVIVEGER